jgi:hypothetical protein
VSARGAPKGARLRLGDDRVAAADRALLRLPQPGMRDIVLESAAGEELDRVRFEVRGLLIPRAGTTRSARDASAGK